MSTRSRRGNAEGAEFKSQKAEIEGIISELRDALRVERVRRQRAALLESVSVGLYDEIDKLSKKAPAESVTDLALGEINQVIVDVKQIADDDQYIARLAAFVPAGDNPDNRDVVLVLRSLRQGLNRLTTTLATRQQKVASYLVSAQTVQAALELKLADSTLIDEDTLREYVSEIDKGWLDSFDKFNFSLLANTNLKERFALE